MRSQRRPILNFLLFLGTAILALAIDLRVGTLNCYLFFDPSINHVGKVDEESRMTPADYQTKIENLSTLLRSYEVVALQETGGRNEITALASKARLDWLWTQGKDTATGEEVGLLYHLPGWKVTSHGRVGELDKVVSKHLLVSATKDDTKVYFLAVHLLRPIGTQAEKHDRQRAAIGAWMRGVMDREPKSTVVVLGDTNNSEVKGAVPLYGAGTEAGTLNQFAVTHLSNKCFDRLVVTGAGHWTNIEIRRPPYSNRPNDFLKRVWTDHYFVGATLSVP
jgi:hypothetical protein